MLFQLKKGQKGRLLARTLPAMVWIAASIGVINLFYFRSVQLEVPGIAQADEHTVASTANGWLNSLPVEPYQEVKQGETLAIIRIYTNPADETRIKADKAAAEAELQRLKAELLAAGEELKADAAQQEFDYSDVHRRLALDVENARLAALEIRTILEPDQVLLKDFELEIRITKNLMSKGAAEEYELQKVQVQYDSLARKIEEHKTYLAQAEQNLKNTEQRLVEFAQNKPIPVVQGIILDPVRKEVLVQERRITDLLVERDTMVITAPFDAVVSSIMRRTGEMVLEGETILTIARKKPHDIIAYVKQNVASLAHENMKVQVIKKTYPPKMVESPVISVGPTILLMPEQLWQNPTIPEWGRPIRIAYNQELGLVPNEVVWIRGL